MRPTLTATDLFASRGRVDILRVLWGVRVPLTAADLARHARLSHPAATAVLRELDRQRLVSSGPAGRGSVYWLNRDNVYVKSMIDPVFAAEHAIPEQLVEALRVEFEGRAVAAVLFGSYARGDQETDSDVDVVLVAADAAGKETLDRRILEYASEFRARYGATLSAITYEAREANALWRTAPAFLEPLRRDAVVISGRGPWEWTDDEQG